MGTLSVVIAVHNVAEFLPECLDSVLAGAPDDLDVVVVNDASSDSCGHILERYARADQRVVAVHLAENVGLGPARNLGLDRATGDYVWFVDGDDRVAGHSVSAVVRRLDALRAGPVRGDALRAGPVRADVLLVGHALLDQDGERDDASYRVDFDRLRRLAVAGPVALWERPDLVAVRQAAWNRIVRRTWLADTGLRFPTGWYEDVGFSHLSLAWARRIVALDQVCYLYRQRSTGAITATTSERHFDVFDQYQALFAELDRRPTYDGLRARLFAQMIEHYLVIVGTEGRVPPLSRPAFFARIVEHYRQYLPAGGYPVPRGVNGVKHRFVRWDSYAMYAAARSLYRGRQGSRWSVAGSRESAERRQVGPAG